MFNTIGYLEVQSSSPEASGEFFRQVFGWELKGMSPGYTEFRTPAGPGGVSGAFGAGDAAPPQAQLAYISVESIDETLGRVVAGGGLVLLPRTLISEEIGSYAQFRDPGGTIWGLYQLPQKR